MSPFLAWEDKLVQLFNAMGKNAYDHYLTGLDGSNCSTIPNPSMIISQMCEDPRSQDPTFTHTKGRIGEESKTDRGRDTHRILANHLSLFLLGCVCVAFTIVICDEKVRNVTTA